MGRDLGAKPEVEKSLAVMAGRLMLRRQSGSPKGPYEVLGQSGPQYATLAGWIHPEVGVYFTPYSTVELEVNMHFTSEDVRVCYLHQHLCLGHV